MRTRKPISTISYNTEEFLKMKLDELMKNKQISFYMFIPHFGEDDESHGKKHFHVYIVPNGQLDTVDLRLKFRQEDPSGNPLPLGVIDFKSSKVDDWLLYSEHYPEYLASKFQSRSFIYGKDDFRYSDINDFEDAYYHAHFASDFASKNKLLQMLNDNTVNPCDLITSGTIPLQMANQVNAYKYMQTHYGSLDRNGRVSHYVKAKEEFFFSDNDITIDNLCRSDIVELSDKSDIDDVIYRLNR